MTDRKVAEDTQTRLPTTGHWRQTRRLDTPLTTSTLTACPEDHVR